MALPTLDELLDIPTQQEVHDQEVLPEQRTRRVRVTDWIVGGVWRGATFLVSRLYVQARTAIAALAAAGFEDYAFGLVDAPNGIDVTGWAPLVAKQRYRVELIEATYTRRTIKLTNASASVYGPLAKGDIVVEFADTGNRYILDEAVTIPASDDVDAVFRSEYTVESSDDERLYVDQPDSTIVIVTTSYPGVTATNPEPDYSDVEQVGDGTGAVEPSGTPSGDHSVAVRIDTSGQAGVATWSTSVDGGTWTSQGAAASITNLGGYGIDIDLTNGSTTPSFIEDSLYYFQTPGTDLVEVGRDVETPQELGARVRALVPVLAFAQDDGGNWIPVSPTLAAYEALARSASDQVKLVLVRTNGSINNRVDVYVAGQGAVLSAATIALIQQFFDHWTMLTDLPVVASPTARAVTFSDGVIRVKAGQLTAARKALRLSLIRYFNGTDAEAIGLNPTVDHAYIVSLVRRTAGVVGFNDTELLINGAAANLELPGTPGAIELATWSGDIDEFTWEIA